MNRVDLVGRLTKDPEIKVANSGTSIARFSVAVDRRFKREGEPDADFINILAFGKTAEFVEKYFKKGMKIGLSGSIQTGSYKNREGATVYTTDVVADSVEFVESKGTSTSDASAKKEDGFVNVPDVDAEELPFN